MNGLPDFRGRPFLDYTAAGGAFAAQSRIDDGGSTSHTNIDGNRCDGTVFCAGPAFHARIAVFDPDDAVVSAEDCMGAHRETHAAPRAFFAFQGQCGYVF